jgi:hypothetical protein
MTEMSSSPERDRRLAEARRMLSAYGADPARWPEEARPLYQRYKEDFRFETARRDADALDALLAAAPDETASDVLRMRLLESAPSRRARSFGPVAWIAGRLVPAGALAGLSLAGFVSGFASAGYEAGGHSYADNAAVSAFESADAAWTEDSR